MAEAKFYAVPTIIDYKCDKCLLGRMRPVGISKIDMKIIHKCNKCGECERFTKQYPHMDFKEGEEIKEVKLIT